MIQRMRGKVNKHIPYAYKTGVFFFFSLLVGYLYNKEFSWLPERIFNSSKFGPKKTYNLFYYLLTRFNSLDESMHT